MKQFLGNLALEVAIATVMGSLSGINHCMDLHDGLKQRLKHRRNPHRA